ncbi:MAG TPA: YqgE/AlgH family protein [Xanthobacteraceae bacterium]|jgi:putative transcriptional regulator
MRAILGLATALCLASLNIARPLAADTHSSLAGQLLVATPSMGDPRFDHAVILMVRHAETGALGIVVNKPLGERPLATLLEIFGEKGSNAAGEVRIFAGGPVQPEFGFVVHTADYHLAKTLDIDGRLAMTSNREILLDIAANKGPKKSLIAFGYAGWGPGQLEGEIAKRVWSIAPADEMLIFDEDREKVWESAYSRRVQDL